MTTEKKLQLAEMIMAFFDTQLIAETGSRPVIIGHLKKPFGINGFKEAPIGNPVFEHLDRYIIYLETLDGKTSAEIPFYKDSLKNDIEFL